MLRRAENVRLVHKPSRFSGKGNLVLWTAKTQRVLIEKQAHKAEVAERLSCSNQVPVCFTTIGERSYWLFQNKWHWDDDGLTAEQIYALLVTRDQLAEARINRALGTVNLQQLPRSGRRGSIPDDLQQWVWTRDLGQCRQCSSNVELRFDHIIPVAFGGATVAPNLQILCGPCLSRKSAAVA
jgi:5-methylcytosine-specific restriction endonuclease McrA